MEPIRLFAFIGGFLPLALVAGPKHLAFYGAAESVKPGELLKVTFRAAVTNGASVETRPLALPSLTLAACADHALPEDLRFPRASVRFYKADGALAREIWLCQGSVLISSRTKGNFRHAAYVPEDAATARLMVDLRAKGNGVEVTDVAFAHADGLKEPTRNVNPLFDYGLYNASGYSFMGSARWRVSPGGANWFDLLQGSCYPDPFPVIGGEELEIRITGSSPTWLHCYCCFYPDWKSVGDLGKNKKFFTLSVDQKGPERVQRYDVPPDAKWARVYFQPTGEIRDFRVTGRAKEEK